MKALIQKINKSPITLYGAFAGGGQNFVYTFLNEPNASKTIMGFNFPYSTEMFKQFTYGVVPESFASLQAARKLSSSALIEIEMDKDGQLGIGVAASLATDNEREGRIHKIHVVITSAWDLASRSYEIPSGKFTRMEEDEFITYIIIDLLVGAFLGECPPKYIQNKLDKIAKFAKVGK